MGRYQTYSEEFKTESVKLALEQENYVTREQARSSIFEYIEAYFNTRRRHSAINYVTPDQFERIIQIDKVA